MNRTSLVLPVLLALLAAPAAHAQQAPERPRNIILFISDGCGPASFTMARDYVRDYLGTADHLSLDAIHVGAARTHASDSRVTDSAAGATAYASGVKTYNGAIGVDSLGRPVPTILEAAEARGMATGLVVTTRITHATPAAFSAHVPARAQEAEIAAQQAEQSIDLLVGGGRHFFLPEAQGGKREDGRDLLAALQAKGYTVASTLDAFRGLDAVPAVALLAMDQLAYEVDRDTLAEPSLAEMTRKAIELLSADPDGFFLMVEGSRIDHAAHGNDAAAHLHDILAYDAAVAEALAFARQDGQTLVVSTSDHETGGLTLGRAVDGRSVYQWHPSVLARVRRSTDAIVAALEDRGDTPPEAILRDLAGVDDLTPEEQAGLQSALAGELSPYRVVNELIARRAVVGWTTGGHTAVDVNLYAFGPGSERLRGNHENDEVGRILADLMNLGF